LSGKTATESKTRQLTTKTTTTKGYTMDYRIIRVTLDIAVPDYGGKYQASGMDYIDVHSDAQSLGFSEQEMQLTAKAETNE